MTEMLITQCPHCQTSFRLKQSQLTAARGAVRCGACLQVFNAASHISEDATSATEPIIDNTVNTAKGELQIEPKTAHAGPLSTLEKPLKAHNAMAPEDLDDINLDEELARLEEEEQRAQALAVALDAVASTAQARPSFLTRRKNTTKTDTLDDWSDELLAQEPVAPLSRPTPKETPAAVNIERPLPDSAPVFEALSKPESNTQPESAPAPAFEPEPEPAIYATHSSDLKIAQPALAAEPRREAIPHFADEPLQLDWRPKKSPWKRWLGWSLLNSLALIFLVGQYTYTNFAELARQDNTRPWIENICQLIDCQLPSKVDVGQIKSSNLIVRSHPEFSGALLIDAIIYNRASFSQPFPLLEITFSDVHGAPLASRLFKPQEYLGGELAGQRHMPPQTPIHIALEILEPSGGAVNYSLNFMSPD